MPAGACASTGATDSTRVRISENARLNISLRIFEVFTSLPALPAQHGVNPKLYGHIKLGGAEGDAPREWCGWEGA